MTKTHEEHEADVLRETPLINYFHDASEVARRRVLGDWFNATKARLMALASDREQAARLWENYASRQSTMYSKLYVFRNLLGAGSLSSWEELWKVDIKPPSYSDKALFIKR